ncbi:MAG: VOC family protein [Anaerolineae bacterium]
MFSRRVVPTLAVVDLEEARSFYEDTIGLTLVSSDEMALTFDCGDGSELQVYKRPTPAICDQTAAAFEVEDVVQAVHDLSSRGVRFEHYDLEWLKTDDEGIADLSGEKAAWFKDPAGNILALYEPSMIRSRETSHARGRVTA